MPSAKSRRLERAPDSPWITVEVAADYLGVSDRSKTGVAENPRKDFGHFLAVLLGSWSGRLDSNQRPLGPESSA